MLRTEKEVYKGGSKVGGSRKDKTIMMGEQRSSNNRGTRRGGKNHTQAAVRGERGIEGCREKGEKLERILAWLNPGTRILTR